MVAALAVGLAWTGPSARARDGAWVVRAGDTLGAIAGRFEVSVDDLRRWNALDGDTIRVGQRIEVKPPPTPEGAPYEVRPGDTLSGIAQRFGTDLERLGELNPQIDPDRLRAGATIRVPGHRIDHRVRRGQTLSWIASYYRVSIEDLERWNPELDRGRLLAGSELRIFSERPPSVSESVGHPWRGRLKRAVQLPRHPAYFLRDRDKAWGTRETIDWILEAFDHVRREHPRAPRVRVHDLSDRDGGWLYGHKSHQSGRDVDLSLYQRRCPDGLCPFRPVGPGDLDVERQWTLLEHWLRRDRLDAVFVDYSLQGPLYRHAKKQGATRKELHRWFQYPRGRTFSVGILRHYPKHHDHLHVRFVCPETDDACE